MAVAASSVVPRPPAAAADLSDVVGGRVFSSLYVATQPEGDGRLQQTLTSAWLQATPRFSDSVRARVVASGTAMKTSMTDSWRFVPALREAYLSSESTGLDLRVGQQIISWGNADGFSPNDVLTAKDFTFFDPDEETRRLGAPSVSLVWTPRAGLSPFRIQAVVGALFPRSRLLIPASLVPPGARFDESPIVPAYSIDSTEQAIKATYAGEGWDISAMAFRGWSHAPELTYAGFDPALGEVIVRPSFQQVRAAGAEGTLTREAWVFRADAAYTATSLGGSDPRRTPSRLDAVFGVERPLGNRFRVSAQSIWRFCPRLLPVDAVTTSDPIEAMAAPVIARANAILLGYDQRLRPAASLRAGYVDEARGLSVDAFALANLRGHDFFVSLTADLLLRDAVKVVVGVQQYGGRRDSQLGSMSRYSAVLCELKYMF